VTETANAKKSLTEQLLKVARENLDQSEIGASQEAIAKGLLRVADDNEGTKNEVPDSWLLEFTTKS